MTTTLPREGDHRTGLPGSVPPFFDGLLPEGRRLALLQQALKTSGDDDALVATDGLWTAIEDLLAQADLVAPRLEEHCRRSRGRRYVLLDHVGGATR